MPARQEDRVARGREIVGEPRQRRLSVDQRLQPIAVARRRLPVAPERRGRWGVGPLPPVPAQAAPVVPEDEALDAGADRVVHAVEPRDRHNPASVSEQTTDKARYGTASPVACASAPPPAAPSAWPGAQARFTSANV